MLRSYLPAIVFLVLGAGIGGLFVYINTLLGPKGTPRKDTTEPYECGLPSEVKSGFRFGISFYMIAMLFILFDIEIVFLYPLAVQLDALGWFGLVEFLVFVAILGVAYVYIWRKGALEWR